MRSEEHSVGTHNSWKWRWFGFKAISRCSWKPGKARQCCQTPNFCLYLPGHSVPGGTAWALTAHAGINRWLLSHSFITGCVRLTVGDMFFGSPPQRWLSGTDQTSWRGHKTWQTDGKLLAGGIPTILCTGGYSTNDGRNISPGHSTPTSHTQHQDCGSVRQGTQTYEKCQFGCWRPWQNNRWLIRPKQQTC